MTQPSNNTMPDGALSAEELDGLEAKRRAAAASVMTAEIGNGIPVALREWWEALDRAAGPLIATARAHRSARTGMPSPSPAPEGVRAALEFYANEKNWTCPEQVNLQELFDTAMGDDRGAIARQALATLDGWEVKSPQPAADVRKHWLAGFMASAEGYNGEYPFDGEVDIHLVALADRYVASLAPEGAK